METRRARARVMIGEPNSQRPGLARREPLVIGVAAVPTDKGQPASLTASRSRCRFTPDLYRVSIGVQCRYQADGPKRQVVPHLDPARQADWGNSRARLGRDGPKASLSRH